MTQTPGLVVGPLGADDVSSAVGIFLEAFHDNVRVVYGDRPRPDAMIDVWSFCRDVEPRGFLAARSEGRLLGFAFFTSSLHRLQRQALQSGRPLVWALRALTGSYGIVWPRVGALLVNKLFFLRSARRFRTQGDAQLVNIAVAAQARGRGVAHALVRAGLRYLHSCGVHEVRLEVRPDNLSAIKVYQDNGFAEVGRTRDRGGEWIVMTAHILELP